MVTKMNEHPIIFSSPMVRVILEGRKVQTRRIIKKAYDGIPPGETAAAVYPARVSGYIAWWPRDYPGLADFTKDQYQYGFECPYGQPGDKLWVRETWAAIWPGEVEVPLQDCNLEYRADLPGGCTDYPGGWPANDARGYEDAPKWRPSIHMPRWASRITLEITVVRVERVQDISGRDALAEGVTSEDVHIPYWQQFAPVWNSINAKRGYSWDVNPWVWVISFARVG